jgi:hypothetical protein
MESLKKENACKFCNELVSEEDFIDFNQCYYHRQCFEKLPENWHEVYCMCGKINTSGEQFVIREENYVNVHCSKKCRKIYKKSTIRDICSVCGNTNKKLKYCGRCHNKKYCSPECQKKDWPSHKLVCKKNFIDKITTKERCFICNELMEDEDRVILSYIDESKEHRKVVVCHNKERKCKPSGIVYCIYCEARCRRKIIQLDEPFANICCTEKCSRKLSEKYPVVKQTINLDDPRYRTFDLPEGMVRIPLKQL